MTLSVENLSAGYGPMAVLRGVDFHVDQGEVVSLLGRNGSGRSTTCKAIMKLLPGQLDYGPTGKVTLSGSELNRMSCHQIARAGLAYVPEDRLIFSNLTVDENLEVGRKSRAPDSTNASARYIEWNLDEVYSLFPKLHERRKVKAGFLSGGEQQILSIMRSLLGNPLAILLDEPAEGLAPMMVEVIAKSILEMRRRGIAVLLVEQKLSLATRVSDRVLVMGDGQIVFNGTPSQFNDDPEVRKRWLEAS